MTVPSTVSTWGPYIGNGVTTLFAYTTRIYADTDLEVYQYQGADGTPVQLVLGVDYSVSDVGSPNGGNVSLVVPPPLGFFVLIRKVLPILQLADFKNLGAFFAESHEDAFDKLVMVCQQLQEQVTRALQIVPGVADAIRIFFESGSPVALGEVGRHGDIPVYHDGTGIRQVLFGEFILKTVTEDIVSNTALSNDTELFVPMGANEIWAIRAVIGTNSGSTEKFKFTLETSQSATGRWSGIQLSSDGVPVSFPGTTDFTGAVVRVADTAGIANEEIILEALVRMGAIAGNLHFKWAQQVSGANTTSVFINSYIEAKRLF